MIKLRDHATMNALTTIHGRRASLWPRLRWHRKSACHISQIEFRHVSICKLWKMRACPPHLLRYCTDTHRPVGTTLPSYLPPCWLCVWPADDRHIVALPVPMLMVLPLFLALWFFATVSDFLWPIRGINQSIFWLRDSSNELPAVILHMSCEQLRFREYTEGYAHLYLPYWQAHIRKYNLFRCSINRYMLLESEWVRH